jgi:hypothetical protein
MSKRAFTVLTERDVAAVKTSLETIRDRVQFIAVIMAASLIKAGARKLKAKRKVRKARTLKAPKLPKAGK